MKNQLFVPRPDKQFIPSIEYFNKVENKDNKPHGGFWTSTYNKNIGSPWLEWNKYERNWLGLENDNVGFILKIVNSPKILVINTKKDIKKIIKKFTSRTLFSRYFYPDFEKISKFYNAIHLTENGLKIISNEFIYDNITGFFGYDCECTLWFTLDFIEIVEKIPLKQEWIEFNDDDD